MHQRIKPIKQVYAQQQPFSKSKRSKLSKGNRDLTVRISRSNEKYFSSKNVHSLALKKQVMPLTVQQLKSLPNVQSISVDLSLQQAHHIENTLRLLKAFQNLRTLILNAQDFKISPKINILWLERLFKLFRHQRIIIKCLHIPQEIMKKPELPKFIHLISSLKEIRLEDLRVEVEEDNDICLSNLTSLCNILGRYHLEPLDLQLYCFSDNMNAFVPQLLSCLLSVKNLSGLSFWHKFKGLQPNMRQIQENHYPMDIDFLPLFFPHKNLKRLFFLALYNASIVKFFPLEELQELQYFSIHPGHSPQLSDNDFQIWITRLKSCKKLRELHLTLIDCPLLTDVSVENSCNQLLKYLPDLETLDLELGYAPHASGVVPQGFPTSKCQYTPLAVNYLTESLPIMQRIKHLGLGFQIKEISDGELSNLFNTISNLKTLESLKISVFSGSITDLVSSSIKGCLKNLMCLETFALALRNCAKITDLFLEDISSAFTIRKASKSLRNICMNFENTSVSRESMDECSSFIKTQLPYCRIYMVRP